MNYFLSCMAFVLMAIQTFAQTPTKELGLLIQERDSLFRMYNYYESQKSTFWGRQSRQELRNIIETLKEIIRKDTEIVQTVRISGVEKQNHLNTKNMDGLHQIYELENQLSAANSRASLLKKEFNKLQSEQEMQGNYRLKLHFWILFSLISLGILLFMSIRQRQQIIELRKA